MANDNVEILSTLIREIEKVTGFNQSTLADKLVIAQKLLSLYSNRKRPNIRIGTLQDFVKRCKNCPDIGSKTITIIAKSLNIDLKLLGLSSITLAQHSEIKVVWKNSLRENLTKEIYDQLHNINIFYKGSHSEICKHLLNLNTPFGKRLKNRNGLSTPELLIPGSNSYNGTMDKPLKEFIKKNRRKVIVSFPGYFLATSAIFFYLRYIKNYEWLDLDYVSFTAVEVVERIKRKYIEPTIIIVGYGPAIAVFESLKNYHFQMFTPRIEQRIVAPKVDGHQYKEKDIEEGIYSFLAHPLSTNVFEFEFYTQTGKINEKRVQTEDNAPHDAIVKLLKHDNVEKRYILCTPYWQFFQDQGLCEVLDKKDKNGFLVESMLFVDKNFSEKNNKLTTALLIEIRNAWLVLKDKCEELDKTITAMLNDPEYVTVLERSWGIHHL